ncbi:helix-turn-helix transcriptional regulator [Streptomyces sp. VRA16 Mangrove soil]|uniref:helix-turn-helix domain-containing protein n=1 Tax=Streptomyces sp. VRA16 Mangrove soil TaxID=2817434 RepID=UPI001A9CE7C9|nr:helix-turn-helix transcriptional regulator [Streptomyces sp. VRA16 Mangrove soil]MBO1337836.1 helix-turn-helix domain-containing protein [Streptomyces sp. VRA16 Mangrove soil]
MEERVSGDGFAELLRELKDRSGLSYGVLAKRLHMSTSTLHRYCNGTAVPNDYAPVERFARLCKARPEELVELHRRWILADAARGRKGQAEPEPVLPPTEPEPEPESEPEPEPQPVAPGIDMGPGIDDGARGPRTSRRRTAVLAAVTVAAVTGAVVLAVHLGHRDDGDSGRRQEAGATAPGQASDPESAGKNGRSSPSATGSPAASGTSTRTPSADASAGTPSAKPGAGDGDDSGPAVNVGVRPYVYDSPCSQHFLVNSEPEQVGPPASEQDAPRWSAAYGAVSSGEQRVALTVQGTGADTVVLEDLHVRVVGKAAPLAWNDYAMGVGCGGSVETKSFDVDLDNGSPTVTVRNGQRDFPYKVSESDPEVFYVTAHSKAHDVRWELTLDWTSGSRHGTVRVDNSGIPFRTSANAGRPGYDYPLGGGEWIERTDG